jgi:putative transcriptional regulator
MNDDLYNELLESVREGGAILRGEKPASRAFTMEKPDVQQIRNSFHLSQSEFAPLLGISVDTLQNWEQGRRAPQGPARILLQVAAKHPEALWDVVQQNSPHLTTLVAERKASYKTRNQ